ncbi:hypothetical protein ACOMOD_002744 [Enterococcus faecalis]|uniref:hypothetical protein n=1 Tax=Enterococcus sp. DIV1537a TaxID=2774733 RepID=UPI003B87B2BC
MRRITGNEEKFAEMGLRNCMNSLLYKGKDKEATEFIENNKKNMSPQVYDELKSLLFEDVIVYKKKRNSN